MAIMDNSNALLTPGAKAAVTRHNHAKRELRESEESGEGLLDNLPNAALVINPDTSIRYANAALENLTGFTYNEVVGQKIPYPWWIWVTSPENGQNQEKPFGDRVNHFELFRKKNGETFWAEVTTIPVSRDGELRYYLSSWVDVTRYKNIEKRLVELDAHYRTILDGIIYGVLVTDKNDVIRYSNEVMKDITGKTPQKMYGKSIFTDFLEDLIGFTGQHYTKAKNTLQPLYLDGQPITGTDRQKTYQTVWLVPIVNTGFFGGMIITVEDVTERVGAEKKLTKYEELRKFKNDLLARVSHELRNPLATIKGYSTLLLKYESRLNNKEKQEYLESIDNSTDTLTRLVSQLIDMSHLQEGLLKLRREPTNTSKLLEETIAEARLRSPEYEIVNDLGKWLPKTNIDAGRIKQVMENLIDNACKYSTEGTKVTISASSKNQELLVRVTDEGMGIAEDELEKIFDQMYRCEPARALGKPGLGLGLTICREIIEAHGGRIWAESQPGKGSIFQFLVPLENHTRRRGGYRTIQPDQGIRKALRRCDDGPDDTRGNGG